ncbi:MAG: SMP-30/gluconolactonase/LRE family protein [Terriglobales bacterium]
MARKPEPAPNSPHLHRLLPAAALPGGDLRIEGLGLAPRGSSLPVVQFGELSGPVWMSSENALMVRVPEGALSGKVQVLPAGAQNGASSNELHVDIAVPISEDLHPVANPVVDRHGNIFVTFSGARGQGVPVSLFQIDTNYNVKPLSASVLNATGLALDREGALFVSSRHEGAVYRVGPNGVAATYAEGMGVATGLAFDAAENLYVGDRSGTIFKIDRQRKTFVFATLEPSISAYHLAFGPDRHLYVTGPTTSSFDTVWRVSPHGAVEPFFRGLGRPQGLAFDGQGNLFIAASLRGRRGVVRITPGGEAELAISGYDLVGLSFAPGPALILATGSALFHLDWPAPGLPLPPEG